MAKHSTSKKKETSVRTQPLENPRLNYFFMKEEPVSDAAIERYADMMLEWAKNDPDALKVSQFFGIHDIPTSTFYDWKDRNPYLAKCYEQVKIHIGNRRFMDIYRGKADRYVATHGLRDYCDEWKRNEDRREAVKKESQTAGSGSVTVVMQPVDNSDLVPKHEIEGTD